MIGDSFRPALRLSFMDGPASRPVSIPSVHRDLTHCLPASCEGCLLLPGFLWNDGWRCMHLLLQESEGRNLTPFWNTSLINGVTTGYPSTAHTKDSETKFPNALLHSKILQNTLIKSKPTRCSPLPRSAPYSWYTSSSTNYYPPPARPRKCTQHPCMGLFSIAAAG